MESNNFPIDTVKRTKANLMSYRGEFAVTNLINCTLGLIVLPYEHGVKNLQQTYPWNDNISNIPNLPPFQIHYFEPIKVVKKGGVKESFPKTLEILLKKIRNGLAHQHIIPVNKNGRFEGVIIKNYYNETYEKNDDPDLNVEFSISQLEEFALFIADEYLKLYFEIGKNYILDPISKRRKKYRGRSCSIIKFVSPPGIRGSTAKVRYLDTNRIGKVELYELS